MKYDRRKSWNKTQVTMEKRSFEQGYNMVMHACDYTIYTIPKDKKPFTKGMLAGIKKRKEMELENLLTGKQTNKNSTFIGTTYSSPNNYFTIRNLTIKGR